MKIKLSFPNSLPLVGIILGAAIPLGYYLGIMISQLFFTRMRSTWILGIFWLPFLAFKPALIGLMVGSVLWFLTRPFRKSRPLTETEVKALKISLVLVILLSASVGTANILREVARHAPHVVHASGEISKIDYSPPESNQTQNVALIWEWSSEGSLSNSIVWNDDAITAYGVDSSIVIANKDQILRRLKLGSNDDSCNAVYAIAVRFNKDKPEYLALLAEVNSIVTSYVLLIFDSTGQLIYHEILKPATTSSNSMQKITDPLSRKEVLVVDVYKPAAYRGN
jgi:hypothetical protein